MNGFYKVKVNDYGEKPEEWSGVVVGNDEGDLMNKVMKYYGHDNVEQVSFWFGEFYDNDLVEIDSFKDVHYLTFTKNSDIIFIQGEEIIFKKS